MKTILSLRRHHYLKTVGILLIAAALIIGIVSCNGAGTYDLVIDSTAGGSTTPSEGTHTYDARTVVDLVATPDCGYVFDKWTGDTVNIDDVNAAATNITMSADYSVTANFEPIPPDHYKFYWTQEGAPDAGVEVQLEDQFGTFDATVRYATSFGNPVGKEHTGVTLTPIADDNRHYTLYELEYDEADSVTRSVEVYNQFQKNVELTVWGPIMLAVPTEKEGHEMVECLNHYLVYYVGEADYYEFTPVEGVNLKDQFIPDGEDVTVKWPYYFANPVKKTVVDTGEVAAIEDADLHWVLYDIYDGEAPFMDETIQIANQFGNDQILDLTYRDTLAVPSQKISWEQPLDHFKTYWVDEMAPISEVVQLEDQFATITANVTWANLFANPVEKQAGVEFSELSPIFDARDHLMFYDIDMLEGEGGEWEVLVDNQFGTGQWLRVSGPIMVIVPTEKIPHGPTEDLNHFLVYEVLDWELTPEEPVLLWDQFTPEGPEFNLVGSPMLFAVPAQKTHLPAGPPTPIIGDEHLLFYWIDGGLGSWEPIVYNQFFGPGPILVYQGDGDWFPSLDLLGVPSVKTWWAPWEPT